ncbi:hypothetical protein LRS13_20335 [Svornostia abyssi]|uniref:Uncharacterized protein n=1 Tax=Svornostia abyssi TaxID=2898438 RepID=A0ABY5PEF5_9ACTN|nr:hypothetical protein LRS13_20335 [Parviterribacteraceae bacterium J379]
MRAHTKYLLAAAITALLVGAPIAIGAGENQPVNGGARNPAGGSTANYTQETQIIANLSGYGTRQSNKSNNGGGAIYGCRSQPGGTPAGNEPCIRASNLVNGLAFEFANNGGTTVGTITSGNPNAAPFTTNATGVATGLNADQVDGQSASQIVTTAQALNSKGQVSEAGVLANARGITSATRTAAGTYTVTFSSDVSACALNATVVDAANNGDVAIAPNSATVYTVTTRTIGGVVADRAFHITSLC